MYKQAPNQNLTRYNTVLVSYEGRYGMFSYSTRYEGGLFDAIVTSITDENVVSEKTVPRLGVWYQVQETTEMVRNTQYMRYHRTRTQAQHARWNIPDTEHKIFIPYLIWDSGSKIQDPKTIQQCINPHPAYELWRYYNFHAVMAHHIPYIKFHTTTTGHELRTSIIWQEIIYDAVDDFGFRPVNT